MRRSSFFFAIFLVAGCGPKLPDGRFGCDEDSDCPSTQFCDQARSLCFTSIHDAGSGDAGDSGTPCVPTSEVDVPDALGHDTDCDGIDGIASDAIFVDGAHGSDAAAGTRAAPVLSVGKALELAVAETKHSVVVANGTVNGSVVLVDGISIHGGYDAANQWSRAPLTGAPRTTLTSAGSPVVLGTNLVGAIRITGLRVLAPDAAGSGTSSVAMRLVDVADTLAIEHAVIEAGSGASGVPGTTPLTSPAMGGMGNGGAASKVDGVFTASNGLGTNSPCNCGAGGFGAFSWANPASDRTGADGDRTAANSTCESDNLSDGTASAGGASTSGNGLPGTDGVTPPVGPGGAAGQYAPAVTEAGFIPVSGGPGTAGRSGGGGGGGSSGLVVVCPDGTNLLSSTGAAGGAGGCGGDGGTGGWGGGASIAFYLWRSTPTLIDVLVIADTAGAGGAGGAGVMGAMGGPGGSALSPTHICPTGPYVQARRGGNGGSGATGAQGSQGGGGAGGVSAAFVFGTDSSVGASSSGVVITIGTGGAPGAGGNPGQTGPSCGVYRASDSACLPALP